MHRARILTGVAAAALIVAAPAALTSNGAGLNPIPPAHAQAQFRIGIDFFYDRLADHGRWVRHPVCGFVWVPTVVPADWAPYTHGRWIFIDDYGWYFASDEPFAWAAYHYGRWGYEPAIGWYWVPGTTWAPAWVAWRTGDEFVGWAPLPPLGADCRVDAAVVVEVRAAAIPRHHFHFIEARQFVAPRLETVIVRAHLQPALFERTRFVGPVRVEQNVVFNDIVQVSFIEQHIQQNVVIHNVQIVDQPEMAATAQIEAETVQIFQAEVAEAPEAEPAEVVELEAATAEAPTAGQVDEGAIQALEAVEEPADLQAAEGPDGEEPTDLQAAEEPDGEEPTDLQAAEEPDGEEPADLQAAEEPDGEEPTDLQAAEEPEGEEPTDLQAAEEPDGEEPTDLQAAEEPEGEEPADLQAAEEPDSEEPTDLQAAEEPEGVTGEAEERPALEAPEPEAEAVEPAPEPEAAPAPPEELLPQQ